MPKASVIPTVRERSSRVYATLNRRVKRKVPIDVPIYNNYANPCEGERARYLCPITWKLSGMGLSTKKGCDIMPAMTTIETKRGRSKSEFSFSDETIEYFGQDDVVKFLTAAASNHVTLTLGEDFEIVPKSDGKPSYNGKRAGATARKALEELLEAEGLVPKGYRVGFSTKVDDATQIGVTFKAES